MISNINILSFEMVKCLSPHIFLAIFTNNNCFRYVIEKNSYVGLNKERIFHM